MAIGIPVKNIMTKPVVKIEYNKTVREAAQLMSKHRVGSIIVTKNKKPVGIITETDINKKIVAEAKDPRKIKVEDIMSSPLIFVLPDDDLLDVVEKMKRHKIKRIPVIEKGRLIGIVTNTDIARTTPELLDILNYRLMMRQEQPTLKETSTSGICEICGEYSDDLRFINDQWVCERCREE